MDANTLNLKSIDVMLEHKIITPDYVKKLVDNLKNLCLSFNFKINW